MRFRKFLAALVGLPLALAFVLFAVANRQSVTLGFDPFSPEAPALSLSLPLFAVVLISLMIGVAVGGCAAWLRQGKHRKVAKRRRQEIDRLETEIETARREAAAARRSSAAALPAPTSQRAA